MVAYKKLSKEERSILCKRMSKNYYENSEVKKLLEETNKEWEDEVNRDIPSELYGIREKYPKAIATTTCSINLRYLSENKRNSWFPWPDLKCSNVIYGFRYTSKIWATTTDYMNVLGKYNYKLYNKIMNDILPALNDIDNFANDLECALNSISTVNGLKNKMPEAYKIYVDTYGEPTSYYSSKNSTSKKCDNIEKVRAIYNSTKINK